ncbi:major facilitator superfamily domain-containing protein [Collybia nuda]|uniref:Major facilitator superfamily domain-containing protein n=1 Tax=Collybia nuda TaxID=64659 RepID=A0A9P5Y4L6_9AGAR|nr:major facilitator superfamily domain-containing protein [Collybia nuda]
MTGGFSLPLAEQGHSTQTLKGTARILGPEWSHLPTLTIGMLGVQIFWSVEMGYASPYLLSLGLSKSSMSLVFLAGPLSGLIMQPLIGVLADNSTSRFGRRRPYMLLGTMICVFAMLLLGYTRGIAAIFTGWNNKSNDSLTIVFAVLSIYLIDFAINAVQALDRALLVDTLSPALQAAGNAWAARMLGFGAVVGFFVGTIPLPSLFPFLGTTQLQILSVIVSLLLLGGHILMAICVKERILAKVVEDTRSKNITKPPNAILREIRELWINTMTLPRVIRQICIIQFFAWIAWFPLLFYTTIYIGDLYKRSTPMNSSPPPILTTDSNSPHLNILVHRARDAEATRLGSRALFCSALLALFINLVAPAFVATAVSRGASRGHAYSPAAGAESGLQGNSDRNAYIRGVSGIEHQDVTVVKTWAQIPEAFKVNLAGLWAVSHLVLGLCLLGTLFTNSVTGATILITITGFSWAITQWAPFSLLAEAILTEPDPSTTGPGSIQLADARTHSRIPDDNSEGEREIFLPGDHSDSDSDIDSDQVASHAASGPVSNKNAVMQNADARTSRINVERHHTEITWEDADNWGDAGSERGDNKTGLSAKAGIILGIHNVFIVIPQFLVTGLSAIIFAVLDPVPTPSSGVLVPAPQPNISNVTTITRQATRNFVRVFAHETVRISNVVVKELTQPAEDAERNERGGQSDSVVYILRLGGVAALIAFVLSWRLAKELRHR